MQGSLMQDKLNEKLVQHTELLVLELVHMDQQLVYEKQQHMDHVRLEQGVSQQLRKKQVHSYVPLNSQDKMTVHTLTDLYQMHIWHHDRKQFLDYKSQLIHIFHSHKNT